MLRQWKRWFAWYPVWIDGEMFWLRSVERREGYYGQWDELRRCA
jgi:hypothetical protein